MKIWDKVTIKSISKEWVRRQTSMPPLESIKIISEITDQYIVVKTWEIENKYYRWEVVFKSAN